MSNVTHAAAVGSCRAIRQSNIAAHDLVLVFRSERSALGDIGLDQAQSDVLDSGARRRRQPVFAEAGDERKGERRDDRRSEDEAALAKPPQGRARGENRNRKERQAMQADQRSAMRQRPIGPEGQPDVVPRKTRDQETAPPFGEPEPEGERENSRRSGE